MPCPAKGDVQSDGACLVLMEKSGRHRKAVGEGRASWWLSLKQLQSWNGAERCGSQLCLYLCNPLEDRERWQGWRAGWKPWSPPRLPSSQAEMYVACGRLCQDVRRARDKSLYIHKPKPPYPPPATTSLAQCTWGKWSGKKEELHRSVPCHQCLALLCLLSQEGSCGTRSTPHCEEKGSTGKGILVTDRPSMVTSQGCEMLPSQEGRCPRRGKVYSTGC